MKFFALLAMMLSANFLLAVETPTDSAQSRAKADPEVVQDEVDRLKENVLDRKSQLLLLRQLIRAENLDSSFPMVTIVHINEMGSRYKVVSLSYTIDGEKQYNFSSEGVGAKEKLTQNVQVFKGPLVPGNHDLQVDIVYKGNDTGVFSYINEYKTSVQAKRIFSVDKGQNITIQSIGYEKGWALTDFKDRPDVKFKLLGANTSKELK